MSRTCSSMPGIPTEEPPRSGPRKAALLELLAQSLKDGEPIRVSVSGQCMEPLVEDGDEISVAPPGDITARVGELWLAHTPEGELVCHRVIARRPDGLLLAGDRTLRADLHARESLLGRVGAVHRGPQTFPIRTTLLDRLQARMHSQACRHRRSSWVFLWQWPRRLLIEIRALPRYYQRWRLPG